jgi:hypothetical protein
MSRSTRRRLAKLIPTVTTLLILVVLGASVRPEIAETQKLPEAGEARHLAVRVSPCADEGPVIVVVSARKSLALSLSWDAALISHYAIALSEHPIAPPPAGTNTSSRVPLSDSCARQISSNHAPRPPPRSAHTTASNDIGTIDRRRRRSGEKVFGDDGIVSKSWLDRGRGMARAVGRIELNGRGFGSGFVMDAGMLRRGWTGQVLITNNHVVSRTDAEAGRPGDVEVVFESGQRLRIDEVLWESGVDDLDVTIAKLDGVVEAPAYRVRADSPSDGARLYLISYPGGGELSFSLEDNRLLEQDGTWLHYRTPSLPGSSGGPVFDAKWDLVAIHRGGSETMARLSGAGVHPANEGIALTRVITRLSRMPDCDGPFAAVASYAALRFAPRGWA